MGRLTLNVLLSFAQFEREVTAERIRDKIAASRAKGMWMGGGIPLGYDVRDRKLVINEAEAKIVRLAFNRYLELGSIGELRSEFEAKGIKTKAHLSNRGNNIGGGKWYVGPLRHVLRNQVYVGLAIHKGQAHQGQHQAIVPKPVFDRVQEMLSRNNRTWQKRRTVEASGLLTGLIFEDKGNRMTPQWSVGQKKTKHGYYVSQALLQRRNEAAGSLPRVSAPVVDDAVLRCVRALQFGYREAAHAPSDRPDSATKVRATVRKIVASSVELRIDCVGLTPTKGRSNAAGQLQHIEEQLPAGAEILQTDRGLQILLLGRL